MDQWNLGKVFINNTLREKNIFFVVDRVIDIITEPIFISQPKNLLINEFYLKGTPGCYITDKVA